MVAKAWAPRQQDGWATKAARFVVGDLSLPRAQAVVADILDSGGSAVASEFDLAQEASVRRLIDSTVAAFGGVDLPYNVGASIGPGSALSRDRDVVEIEIDA